MSISNEKEVSKSMISSNIIPRICETIWKAEVQFNLFDWTERDIYVWPLLRMELYYRITFGLNIYHEASTKTADVKESPVPKPAPSKFQLLRRTFSLKRKCSALFLTGSRLHPETKLDVFLYPFFEREKKDASLVLADQNIDLALPKKESSEHVHFHKSMAMPPIEKKNPQLSANGLTILKKLAIYIEEELQFNQDYVAHARAKLRTFDKSFAYYSALFRNKNPQRVYLTCSYGKESIIAAAHASNVRVIEVQHGTIHPYHMGYVYPIRPSHIPYYPDQFICWSPFWIEHLPFIVPEENIEFSGNYLMREQLAKMPPVKKKLQQLVVVSQSVLSNDLADFLLQTGISDLKMPVIFKLHPQETGNYQEKVLELSKLPHVTVTADRPLLPLLAESEYAVGVFSTSIFEAATLQCKIVLAKLPGIESMVPFADRFEISIAKLEENAMIDCLSRAKKPAIQWDDLF